MIDFLTHYSVLILIVFFAVLAFIIMKLGPLLTRTEWMKLSIKFIQKTQPPGTVFDGCSAVMGSRRYEYVIRIVTSDEGLYAKLTNMPGKESAFMIPWSMVYLPGDEHSMFLFGENTAEIRYDNKQFYLSFPKEALEEFSKRANRAIF